MTDTFAHDTDASINIEVNHGARSSSNKSESNAERLLKLEPQFSELSLTTEALWTLLTADGKFSDSQLLEKVAEVKLARKARNTEMFSCSDCGMKTPAKKEKCIYCGCSTANSSKKSPFSLQK